MKFINCPTCAGGHMAYHWPDGCPHCEGNNRVCVLTVGELADIVATLGNRRIREGMMEELRHRSVAGPSKPGKKECTHIGYEIWFGDGRAMCTKCGEEFDE